MATSGDLDLATSGDFLMATDSSIAFCLATRASLSRHGDRGEHRK
jgi:hypothetical protein